MNDVTGARERYLASTVAAIRAELAEARRSRSSIVSIEAGQRVNAGPGEATYRFTLVFDSVIPEGVPVRLEVGPANWEAEVLQREGLSVLLLVRRNADGTLPAPAVPSAVLNAQPWYLLDLLATAVEELGRERSIPSPTADLLALLTSSAPGQKPVFPLEEPEGLNTEQAEAVSSCSERTVWFVWGPPGTGKTTTLGHVVSNALVRGESVLVCAHSNVAVDAALKASVRAAPAGVGELPVVRAGPPALPEVRALGLSTRERAFDANPRLKEHWEKVGRRLGQADGESLRSAVAQWREIAEALKKTEDGILRQYSSVFATLSKLLSSNVLASRSFDHVIIDEVSMAFPAQVLVASARARRRVSVFGDCRQLAPIITSGAPAVKDRLGRDIFTACAVDRPEALNVTMLKEQFRMHPEIRCLVSDFVYGGCLRDAPNILNLRKPTAETTPVSGQAVVWVDTDGLGAKRFFDTERQSRFNPLSAIAAVRQALEARTQVERVVILTPYRRQARLLSALISDSGVDHVEIGTVHRYQGSEAPVVVLDLVDTTGRNVGRPLSGTDGERLLNVGISRAQGKIIVVGSRTMPRQGLTFRSLTVLRQAHLRRLGVSVTDWPPGRKDGFSVTITRPDRREPLSALPTDVLAAWLPPSTPGASAWLGGPIAEPWSGGHVAWVGRHGGVGLHEPGQVTIELTAAPRFADALADALNGAPLTRRRPHGGGAEDHARPARYDECDHCGSPAHPVSTLRWSVQLGCTKCHRSRNAADREVRSWLRKVGPRCPRCHSAMNYISGQRAPHGVFLGCSDYPNCRQTLPVEALLEACAEPDPPAPPELPTTPARRRAAAPARGTLDERTCTSCFLTKAATAFSPASDVCNDCA